MPAEGSSLRSTVNLRVRGKGPGARPAMPCLLKDLDYLEHSACQLQNANSRYLCVFKLGENTTNKPLKADAPSGTPGYERVQPERWRRSIFQCQDRISPAALSASGPRLWPMLQQRARSRAARQGIWAALCPGVPSLHQSTRL